MALYVAGQHMSRKRRAGRAVIATLVAGALVAGAGFAAKDFLRDNTTISSAPPPVTSKVATLDAKTQRIDTRLFSFKLPTGWQAATPPNQPYQLLSWQNAAGNKGVRNLTVYVDGAPQMPVNRSLPVQANGAQLSILGSVSDNCINFTQAAKQTSSDSLPGKWQGVNFLCDTANYARDVVGTSSPDGINTVELSSAANGNHSFFFTYTDNSATPEYNIFIDALNSFKLK